MAETYEELRQDFEATLKDVSDKLNKADQYVKEQLDKQYQENQAAAFEIVKAIINKGMIESALLAKQLTIPVYRIVNKEIGLNSYAERMLTFNSGEVRRNNLTGVAACVFDGLAVIFGHRSISIRSDIHPTSGQVLGYDIVVSLTKESVQTGVLQAF